MEGQQEMTAAEETAYRETVAAEMWGEDSEAQGADDPVVDIDDKEEETEAEEVDPWSGVNPALKATFDALQQKVSTFDQLTQRLQSSEGRIGALQRELQQQRNAAEKAAQAVNAAPTQEQMAEASASSKMWEELKEDFPEWAEALEAKTGEVRSAVSKEIATLQSKIDSITAQPEAVGGKIDEIVRTFETKLLTIKHPTWRTMTASPEYREWLQSQTADIQHKAANSVDALECIEILDAYTSGSKPAKTAAEIAAERQARLASAATNVRGGKRSVPTKSVDDMSPEEYRAYISKKIWSD